MCESTTCPCRQRNSNKIKYDFFDIFIKVYSVDEERELDLRTKLNQWPVEE